MKKKLKGLAGRPDLPEMKSPLLEFWRELNLVKGHSRLLVLVTNGFLELMVNVLIEAKFKNHRLILKDDSRTYTYSAKLVLLNELDFIKDDRFLVFERFRKLRNRAAHDPIFYVTDQDMQNLKLERFKTQELFHSLCLDLIAEFWNEHTEIFYLKFTPTDPPLKIA